MKKTSLLVASALLASSALFAQDSVTSNVVGYVTQEISAGTGTGRTFTTISLPLYAPASVSGAQGSITTVNANGITVSGANFGDLSDPSAPYAIKVTSGAAEGANFLVSSNNADTLEFNFSLSSMGDTSSLVAGDSYELVAVDTLLSLFGTPADGVLFGAASQSDADVVYILTNGAWLAYYHNNTNWVRKSGRNTIVSDDLPITPDTAILLSRLSASSTSYILTGTVPSNDSVLKINGAGLSFLANNTPADITLGNLGLQNASGFNQGSAATSDAIYIYTSGAWLKYSFDGTNWVRKSGRNTIVSNDVSIASGSGFIFSKGTSGDATNSSLTLQYTL